MAESVTEHRFRDFNRPDGYGPGRARCICGWVSQRRWLETVAYADFWEHQRQMALEYARPKGADDE